MKKQFVLCLFILLFFPYACNAERSKYLDAALPFLEESNPFLVHYNEITGARITPLYPLGCPYFWGGRNVKMILQPVNPGSSSDYYKVEQKYLYGLDCVGFTRWINQKTGYDQHPSISQLLNRSLYAENVVRGAAKSVGEDRTAVLRIGDLLVIQHHSGGYHIAMYCGTLADFGYTVGSLPASLSPYLHYPLLIHCTGSSDYYERYRIFLEEQGQTEILPPFGGVIVTILDVPASAATSATPDAMNLCQPCFDLEGYHLQITDLTQEKQFRWIRWRQRPDSTNP